MRSDFVRGTARPSDGFAGRLNFGLPIAIDLEIIDLLFNGQYKFINGQSIINTYFYAKRRALLLALICLVFSAYALCQPARSEAQSAHVKAGPGSAPARLIIRRNPNLGFNVIVRLWIDGAPAESIGYGHTFQGFLAPGRHVLAVLASPNPRWPTPWQLPLDVQSGRTYGFTAVTDGSGNLILDGRFGFPRRVQ